MPGPHDRFPIMLRPTLPDHMLYPKKYRDRNGITYDVYPTAWRNVLNYGLERKHAIGGVFVTAESLKIREANAKKPLGQQERPYDELSLLDDPSKRTGGGPTPHAATGGMQLARFSVIRIEAGTTLYRFGDEGGYNGCWWSDRKALMRMLLRIEPDQDGLAGVRGGSQYNIRDYARRYSEVLGEWGSLMKYMFATRVQSAIMAFRGMGAAQRSKISEVKTSTGMDSITYEHMADDNIQIYIPNAFGRVAGPKPGEPSFFTPPVKWHPEVLEHNLVPLIKEHMEAGVSMKKIMPAVETWMMDRDRHKPLVIS